MVIEIQLSSNHRLQSHYLSGLGKMLTLWASVSSSVNGSSTLEGCEEEWMAVVCSHFLLSLSVVVLVILR